MCVCVDVCVFASVFCVTVTHLGINFFFFSLSVFFPEPHLISELGVPWSLICWVGFQAVLYISGKLTLSGDVTSTELLAPFPGRQFKAYINCLSVSLTSICRDGRRLCPDTIFSVWRRRVRRVRASSFCVLPSHTNKQNISFSLSLSLLYVVCKLTSLLCPQFWCG